MGVAASWRAARDGQGGNHSGDEVGTGPVPETGHGPGGGGRPVLVPGHGGGDERAQLGHGIPCAAARSSEADSSVVRSASPATAAPSRVSMSAARRVSSAPARRSSPVGVDPGPRPTSAATGARGAGARARSRRPGEAVDQRARSASGRLTQRGPRAPVCTDGGHRAGVQRRTKATRQAGRSTPVGVDAHPRPRCGTQVQARGRQGQAGRRRQRCGIPGEQRQDARGTGDARQTQVGTRSGSPRRPRPRPGARGRHEGREGCGMHRGSHQRR